MTDKIITHPATDEYRAGYDRIFGSKRAKTDGYTYVTYEIEGADRSPEMKAALARSMQGRIEMSMPKDCKLGA